ncbi:MAG: AAA family ATPase [Myxococcota bacterium]
MVALAICETQRAPAPRPLGGVDRVARWRRSPGLAALARDRDVSPEVVILTWLCDLGVIPVVGASTVTHAEDLRRVLRCPWDDAAREAMDALFDPHRVARRPPSARRPVRRDGEVVLLMGVQGAGKSTAATAFEAEGYRRLNRDQRGGTLRGLLPLLRDGLAAGHRHWVLDNTYGRRADRARVREVAWAAGAGVRCVELAPPLAQAQINVCRRLLARYGRLPSPDDLRAWQKYDPQAIGPSVQHRYLRAYEPPEENEAFDAIERRPFVPTPVSGSAALFVSGELLLGDDAPQVVATLTSWRAPAAYAYAFSRGRPEQERAAMVRAWGRPLEVAQCPHGGGPPRCWCRPPLPGLLVWLCHRHRIDPRRAALAGRGPIDRQLAEAMGMLFVAM